VIRLVLSYNPLRVFLPGGLLLFVVAAGKLLFDWVGRDFHLAANTLLIFFAAFQLLVIGLLADLIVRIARAPDEIDPAADERS
jgi:hypothetical protein